MAYPSPRFGDVPVAVRYYDPSTGTVRAAPPTQLGSWLSTAFHAVEKTVGKPLKAALQTVIPGGKTILSVQAAVKNAIAKQKAGAPDLATPGVLTDAEAAAYARQVADELQAGAARQQAADALVLAGSYRPSPVVLAVGGAALLAIAMSARRRNPPRRGRPRRRR